MKIFSYSTPVDKLLTLGDCRAGRQWPNYLELGLAPEHIPELIRMATDKALLWADSDKAEVWAPIHAWRALGQLRAEAAIEPLVGLIDAFGSFDDDYDWIAETLPKVFELIGPPAVPALAAYLTDKKHDLYQRNTAASSLEKIGNRHRAARADCVAALTGVLEKFRQNDPELNGFIIWSLMELHESDALPLMERAYQADCVDESIVGDWQDVRAEFGLSRPSGQFDGLFDIG